MAIVISDTNVPIPLPDTLIAFICDASASMVDKIEIATEGINSFLREQKSLKGEALIYFSTFNNKSKVYLRWTRLRETKFLDRHFLKPDGGTALYDAIVAVCQATQEVWNTRQKVTIVVLTDGQENGSVNNKLDDVQHCLSTNIAREWKFIFISPDEASSIAARQMGFNNIIRYDIRKPETLAIAVHETSVAISDMRDQCR